MSSDRLAPVLPPHGHLILAPETDAPELAPELARRLNTAFSRGSGHGLLQLAAAETGAALPPVFMYWREFAATYIAALCTHASAEAAKPKAPLPASAELDRLILSAPSMT